MAAGEWSTTEHVVRYLARADSYPRRSEGEAVLLDRAGAPRGSSASTWARGTDVCSRCSAATAPMRSA